MDKFITIIKNNKLLVFILLSSFILSLVYSFHFKINPEVDAGAYDEIGWNIAQGIGYRSSPEIEASLDQSIMRVGPLYEFFLAIIYYIFGHSYKAVWIMQALLHTISALLIYLTCLIIFKEPENKKTIALMASAIFAFYPDLVEISAMLLTETLYLFLFCLAIYFFFKYFHIINTWTAIMIGIIFGLATLARPPVLFLIPVIIFYYYKKSKIIPAALFIITLLLVFTPWAVRNYIIYDKFMPFGASGAYNLWIGNYHGGNGEQEPTREMVDYANKYGMAEIPAESMRQFKKFIITYPEEFIKLTILRINKYFSIIRPMGFWFYQTGWSQFIFILSSGLASVVLFVFGLAGLIQAIKIKNKQLTYLIWLTTITPLILFVTVIETRYRFQIYPMLAIFAGYFIMEMHIQKKIFKNKILWLAFVIIFINGFIDLILSFDRLQERLDLFF